MTHGEFSNSSQPTSSTNAPISRHCRSTLEANSRRIQKKIIPCNTCVSEYGSIKCCDVQLLHAAIQRPNPYLHQAGRPSRYGHPTNTRHTTAPDSCLLRDNSLSAPFFIVLPPI